MKYLPPKRAAVFDYLCGLVRSGHPFDMSLAIEKLGVSRQAISSQMRKLMDDGLIEYDTQMWHQQTFHQVTVPDVGSTPWPSQCRHTDHSLRRLDYIRNALANWKSRTGWSAGQISAAMEVATGMTLQTNAIRDFLKGGRILPGTATTIATFLKLNPDVGDFEQWRDRIAARAKLKAYVGDEDIFARREAVEQERKERCARLLAKERRPWSKPETDDFRLDAATIVALSGGTLRSLGGEV